MANRNMRLTNINGTSFVFVDPNDFRRTAKVTWNVQRKSQQGSTGQLFNSKWSLSSLAVLQAPIPEGIVPSTIGTENVSIQTSVSGSAENWSAMADHLDVHIANLLILRDDLLKGLPPKSDVSLVAEFDEVTP